MSTVKCHSCNAEVSLESAHPRGRGWPGFYCPSCFRRQCWTAFLVVGGILIVFAIVSPLYMRRSKDSGERESKYQNHGLANIYHASYTHRGITTTVDETIPYLLAERQYESNWQERLFEPIDRKELWKAGFGFSDMLVNPQNVGSFESPQTPETVTILVKASPKNYYFRVTQKKSAD